MPSRFARFALAVSCTAVLLVGCGGSSTNGSLPSSDVGAASLRSRTFKYIGEKQIFRVPRGVSQIRIIGRGGEGGGPLGAFGGRVSAMVTVTPGEKLVVYVGGDGSASAGGFNGGAPGGFGEYNNDGYGGGGASDVRAHDGKLSDRIFVAAGGGGSGGQGVGYGSYWPGTGGKGGGLKGGNGGGSDYKKEFGDGGAGGTQNAGGGGGTGGVYCFGYNGNDGAGGANGVGGSGGSGSPSGDYAGAGGGGGGAGYYGGGGGGAGCAYESQIMGGGGGGGGSSYVEPGATNVRMWSGWKSKAFNGLVVIDW